MGTISLGLFGASDLNPTDEQTALELLPYQCPQCSGSNFAYTAHIELLKDSTIEYYEIKPKATELIFCLDCEYVVRLGESTTGGQNVGVAGRC